MPGNKAADAAATLKARRARPGILDSMPARNGESNGTTAVPAEAVLAEAVKAAEPEVTEPEVPVEPQTAEREVGTEITEPEGELAMGELGSTIGAGPKVGPVLDRGLGDIGLVEHFVPIAGLTPEAVEPPPVVRPAPAQLIDVDVAEVLATVGELHDAVFDGTPDETVKALMRDAVQAFRRGVAVGRARGLLPPRTISFVVVIDKELAGEAQVFAGDRRA